MSEDREWKQILSLALEVRVYVGIATTLDMNMTCCRCRIILGAHNLQNIRRYSYNDQAAWSEVASLNNLLQDDGLGSYRGSSQELTLGNAEDLRPRTDDETKHTTDKNSR